jgi:hypothetical protein
MKIIDYKWETYTKAHFVKQFRFVLLFIATYLLDVLYLNDQFNDYDDPKYEGPGPALRVVLTIILRLISLSVIIYFA